MVYGNRIAIVILSLRVFGKDGSLTGFTQAIRTKTLVTCMKKRHC